MRACGILFILISSLVAGAAAAGVPHDPIRIEGDSPLLLPDALSSNGIVAGTGTASDPYVIRGWDIEVEGAEIGLELTHVNAHFLVEDVRLFAAAGDPGPGRLNGAVGFRIEQAPHVEFRRVSVVNSTLGTEMVNGSSVKGGGLMLENSALHVGPTTELVAEDVQLIGRESQIHCIQCDLELTKLSAAVERPLDGNGLSGEIISIRGSGSRSFVLRNVTIDANVRALVSLTDANGRIEGCKLTGWSRGFESMGSTFSILDCSFTGKRRSNVISADGIQLAESEADIKSIRLGGEFYRGIVIANSEVHIEGYQGSGPARSIDVLGGNAPSEIVIRNSTFASDGEAAISLEGHSIIDARWNYWGSSSGPAMILGGGGSVPSEAVVTPYWTDPSMTTLSSDRPVPSLAVPGILVALLLAGFLRRRSS